MSKPLSSRPSKFGIARSIGTVICILGILAGIFLMVVGGETFGSAASNDADVRGPVGVLIGFGGLLIFLVPAVGLIALIGSRFAKSTIARVFIKVLGAAAALTIVGAGSLILVAYLKLQPVFQLSDQLRADASAELLTKAEQGDASAQISIGDSFYQEWQHSYGDGPKFCPEALHWYRQAAFQGVSLGMHQVNWAYGNCAPGNYDSNQILAIVWGKLASESKDAESLRHFPSSGVLSVDRLDPDGVADALATIDALTVRAREIFADPDMSATARQLAMDSAVLELLPRTSGDNDD